MQSIKLGGKRKLQILVILAIAVTLSLGFYMYKETPVNLHIDEKVEEVVSRASTVEEFLQEQEITLDKEGYINLSLDRELEENIDVIIKTPKTYTIKLGDAEWDVTSTYTSVEEILTDSGVNFIEENGDYTIPDIRAEIAPGTKISVFRVNEVEKIVKETIPSEKIVRKNPKLELGTTKLIQEGREGIKEIKIKSKFINGELVKEEVLEEKIALYHMNTVIENGTKPKPKPQPKPTRSGTPSRAEAQGKTSKPAPSKASAKADQATGSVRTMSATGYSTNEKGLSRYTANGTDLHKNPRVVAVDPRVIPLGTIVEIEGYGRYVAADTGGAIKGNRIDIHFKTVQECLNFGRRNVKVNILN